MSQKKKKYTKYCYAPNCLNNSKNSPDKVFLSVPSGERGRAWIIAARIPYGPQGRSRYFCEDHFDLENDCQNFQAFKSLMQTRLRVRRDVVPHKYLDKSPPEKLPSQLSRDKTMYMSSTYMDEPLIEETIIKVEAVDPFETIQCQC